METAPKVELRIFIEDLIIPGIHMREIPIDGTAERIGRHMEIHILDGENKLSF